MSSAEEDSNSHMSAKPRRATKKRRVALACDMCRKRKIRCDGKQASGKCSNCITYSWDCSFFDATKKFPKGYVEALEAKLKRHEELLNRLHPNEDFTQDVGRPITREDWSKDNVFGDQDAGASSAFALPSQFNNSAATEVFLDAANSPCNPRKASQNLAYTKYLHDFDSSDDEISPKLQDLTDNFEELHVGRFHGKSSGAILVKSMIEVRDEIRDPTKPLKTFQDEKREQFWKINPWERQTYESRRPSYIFPEPDLLYQLIDAYFENSNIILPVLHRATLEESIQSRRHLVDESLGGVVLIACAIGSRFVSDPRVLYPGTNSKLSSGWFWFSQVRFAGKVLIAAARLYDLQITCLGAIYMLGCSAPHASWNMTGIGMRLAQDIGAHRKKVYSSKPTVEDELFKRSFWTLVCLDRWISSSTGRPCAIQEEDFDLEMPLDCDDEYWTHPDPDQAFKQPPGKPSRITAFICNLRLCQILGYAIRTIYASNKAKATYGFSGENWEQRTIASFDSILNAWADSVPSHLRWDPTREDDVFFIQSAHLYAQFYDLQITVHRPFIAFREPSPHSFPAIAICTNAARSCMRVVDQLLKRWPTRLFPFMHRTVFASTIVVLLGIWDARRRNPASNVDKEISDAHKGMQFLEVSQDRWHPAGTTRDVLSVVLSLIDLTEIGSDPPRGQKRPHEYMNSTPSPLSAISTPGSTTREYSAAHSHDSSDVASSYAGRAMAGSSRVRAAHEQRSINDSFDDGTLPLRTSELGRVDDSDPLGWGTSSFSFTAEFPPTAIAPNTGVPLTQMDSMFLQPESYAGLGGSSVGQSPAGMDMDIGSLFGFGNGGQLPQAPAMDVGATALPYGPFGDLLHNVGTTSSETSANANVWPDTSFEGVDLDWFIPKVFTSQPNSGQAFVPQSNSGQG